MRAAYSFVISQLIALLLFGLNVDAAYSTPSGLNNIPTVDTPADKEVVLQTFTNFGEERNPNSIVQADLVGGLKGGLSLFGETFEYGMDSILLPKSAGPVVFQAKYSRPLWASTTVAVGTANVGIRSQDRVRAGNPFSYMVFAQKIGESVRLHGGYGVQTRGDSALLGIDSTRTLLGRKWIVRGDAVQIGEKNDWLGSVGTLYALHSHFIFESWVSRPFDHGNMIGTVKFNFVFQL